MMAAAAIALAEMAATLNCVAWGLSPLPRAPFAESWPGSEGGGEEGGGRGDGEAEGSAGDGEAD